MPYPVLFLLATLALATQWHRLNRRLRGTLIVLALTNAWIADSILPVPLIAGAVVAGALVRRNLLTVHKRLGGKHGERDVARVLDEFVIKYRDSHHVGVQHNVPLPSERNPRGDLDHALVLGHPDDDSIWAFVAIETKAEYPRESHLKQVQANSERAGRKHFHLAPHWRVVVHPNSAEPPEWDPEYGVTRMGLRYLPGYLLEVIAGKRDQERLEWEFDRDAMRWYAR